MRSWTPRHPSANLEERIFSRERPAARQISPAVAQFARWFAPAFACVVLVLILANPKPVHFAQLAAGTNAMSDILGRGNAAYAAYFDGEHHSEQNRTHQKFEWTTNPRITSNLSSVVNLATNNLFH